MKKPKKVLLNKTCGNPEEYDAYIDDSRIGKLMLYRGNFRVIYRNEVILNKCTEGTYVFKMQERHKWLTRACKALLKEHRLMTRKLLYEVVELVT